MKLKGAYWGDIKGIGLRTERVSKGQGLREEGVRELQPLLPYPSTLPPYTLSPKTLTLKNFLPRDNITMLNYEEFGESIVIDGIKLLAVMEQSTNQNSGNQNLNYPGLHGDFLEVYFRTADYVNQRERLMRHDEVCYVNGKRYNVDKVVDEQGMTHLTLSAYRQGVLRGVRGEG